MRTRRIVTICSILFICGIGQVTQAMPSERFMNSNTSYSLTDEGIVTMAFDREGCESDCKSRFGFELYAGSGQGGRNPMYYAYAACIQECNQRFWKDFDRRTRDLERE